MDQRLLLMHQVMLADAPRLRAYDAALEAAVRPDDVVIDVGAGTLVLSMMALRHGARHVYAIEADPMMAAVAERIAADNDLKGKLTLVQGDARVANLPEQADVIVSEMMGNLGPEEEMATVVSSVARRNLRNGGRIVPRRLITELAAIEFDNEGWGLWRDATPDDPIGGVLSYRLDALQEFAEPGAQLHFFQREPTFLSSPEAMSDDTITTQRPRKRAPSTARLTINRPGTLQAVMGYFTAELADGVSLSNYPSYPGCNWAVWIWPLRHGTVREGDEVVVDVLPPSRSTRSREPTDWQLDCRVVRARR